MVTTPQFDEAELLTLIDRMLRIVPGGNGGKAKIRQVTQRQERVRGGYDAVATSVQPFYIQAKTSEFHPAASKSKIIAARNNIPVNSSPGVFTFYLRKHEGTTEPLQHNALYWLSLRSTAAYVCPTFVSESELEKRLDLALELRRHEIWNYQKHCYTEFNDGKSQTIQARHFHGLMTIVPHRMVDHYLHRYSYDKEINPSIVFHSEPEYVGYAKSLDSFLQTLTNEASTTDKGFANKARMPLSFERFREMQLNWIDEAFDPATQGFHISLPEVSRTLRSTRFSNNTYFQESSGALAYLRKMKGEDLSVFFGSLLKEKYGVYQNLLLRND